MKKYLWFYILLTLIFSACSSIYKIDERTAVELSEQGNKDFKNKDFQDAIKAFEKLCDWYPYNTLKIDAEFKIAESYYKLKKYDDAIEAYTTFEELHPKNEKIPYILFQIGLCSFEQITTNDRDQGATKKALNTFLRLKKEYPDNKFVVEVNKKIDFCLLRLVSHEIYVGKFYFKSKHYKSALSRFKGILKNYPDAGLNDEVSNYISLCKQKIKSQKNSNKKN